MDVMMFMHPATFVYMTIWLLATGYGAWRVSATSSIALLIPIVMIVFGLALSLGSFFSEAIKAHSLLCTAAFNSAINAAPQRPAVPPQVDESNVEPQVSNSRILLVAVVVGVPLVLALAFGQYYENQLRTCPVFQASLALVSESAEARAALGERIQPGRLVRGVVQNDAKAGYALLSISLRGSKGEGTVYIVANRMRDRWDLERVTLWTGTPSHRLDLSPPARPESLRYPTRGAVYLLPLDDSAASNLQGLHDYYAARLGLNVEVLPVLPVKAELVDPASKQVMAERAVDFMIQANPKIAEDLDAVVLGVTSEDLNIVGSGWRYATKYTFGRFAIISTATLHGMPWFAGRNPEVLSVRVRKMVTQSIVSLRYPVSYSTDPTSVLSKSAGTPSDVDRMGEDFIGENGTWSPSPTDLPSLSITQGPQGRQSWTLGWTPDPPNDSRFETFSNYTDIALFEMARTDFPYDSQRYLSFIRKYRTQDDRSRSFGIGGNDSFDIWPAGDSRTFSYIDLFLEDGGRIHFRRVSKGTGYADAKMRADAVVGNPFGGSDLEWNGSGWNVKTALGWTYKFPSSGPDRTPWQSALMRVEMGSGAMSIQRNSNGALQHAQMPDSSWINFTCDSMNRVIMAEHSSGRTVQYEYDDSSRLTHVQDSENGEEFYEYDPVGRLSSVLDSARRPLLINTYGYLGEVTSQTLADHRKLEYHYAFDQNQRPIGLDFTDDHGYVIRWMRGRGGYYQSLPQRP